LQMELKTLLREQKEELKGLRKIQKQFR
jgi:hypothetical protein